MQNEIDNQENPFEVSQYCVGNSADRVVDESSYEFRVESAAIVCGSAVILPRICVYTEESANTVAVKRPTLFPAMTLVLQQRTCVVTYFVSQAEHLRRRRLGIIYVAVGLVGIAFILTGMSSGTPLLFPSLMAGVLTVWICVALFNRLTLPLALIKYSKPGTYWVGGFPQSYLSQIATYRQTC